MLAMLEKVAEERSKSKSKSNSGSDNPVESGGTPNLSLSAIPNVSNVTSPATTQDDEYQDKGGESLL